MFHRFLLLLFGSGSLPAPTVTRGRVSVADVLKNDVAMTDTQVGAVTMFDLLLSGAPPADGPIASVSMTDRLLTAVTAGEV